MIMEPDIRVSEEVHFVTGQPNFKYTSKQMAHMGKSNCQPNNYHFHILSSRF